MTQATRFIGEPDYYPIRTEAPTRLAERDLESIAQKLSAAAFAQQTREGRIPPTEEEIAEDIERLTGNTPYTD